MKPQEQYTQSIQRIEILLEKILCVLENGSHAKSQAADNLLPSEKVIDILKINRRTLYRLRKSGKLQGWYIGNRCYYSMADIFQIKNEFLK